MIGGGVELDSLEAVTKKRMLSKLVSILNNVSQLLNDMLVESKTEAALSGTGDHSCLWPSDCWTLCRSVDISGLGGCWGLTGLTNWTYNIFSVTSDKVRYILLTYNYIHLTHLTAICTLVCMHMLERAYIYLCLYQLLFLHYSTSSFVLRSTSMCSLESIIVCLDHFFCVWTFLNNVCE